MSEYIALAAAGLLVAWDLYRLKRMKRDAQRMIEELHGEALTRSYQSVCPSCQRRLKVYPHLKTVVGYRDKDPKRRSKPL